MKLGLQPWFSLGDVHVQLRKAVEDGCGPGPGVLGAEVPQLTVQGLPGEWAAHLAPCHCLASYLPPVHAHCMISGDWPIMGLHLPVQ